MESDKPSNFIYDIIESDLESNKYDSKVNTQPKYLYSDISFYMFKRMIEKISKTPFESYVNKNFYNKMDLRTIGFNPLKEFKKDILNDNFPSKKETPDIEPDELEIFMTLLDKK